MDSNLRVSVSFMTNGASLRNLNKEILLRDFTALVDKDRRDTATMLAYIGEIDRRKVYLEHACPSMFAFCTKRFGMSEAIAHKRIRGGRAASRFPCILDMLARGEIHLTGVHQLASHLTEENYREVLQRAKRKSIREIEKLVAEIAPQPDVPSSIRALPTKRASMPPTNSDDSCPTTGLEAVVQTSAVPVSRSKPARPVPLAPRRYKLQVTIGQDTRDKLDEVQALLSHQVPDGDLGKVLDHALDALLAVTKKKKAAITDKPRSNRKKSNEQSRRIPAAVRRQVFERDEGRCAFTDRKGRRCDATWQVEFHHLRAYARGGKHDADNIELRCRAHNQYEAELEFGELFMARRRAS